MWRREGVDMASERRLLTFGTRLLAFERGYSTKHAFETCFHNRTGRAPTRLSVGDPLTHTHGRPATRTRCIHQMPRYFRLAAGRSLVPSTTSRAPCGTPFVDSP